MATIIIIEALDKHGKVQQRDFVDRLPFKIGRGYDNDLILDDNFVCSQHAQLDMDVQGNLVVADMGSHNGLFLYKNSKKISVAKIYSGSEIRIGHTRIRFRQPNFNLPAAIQDTLNDHVLSRILNEKWVLWGIWCLMLGVIALDKNIGNFNNHSIAKLLDGLIFDFILMIIWVGVWVAINRLTTHATNLGAHLLVATMGYTGLLLLEGLSNYLNYIFSISASIDMVNHAAILLVLVGVFYGHLRYCSLAPPFRVVSVAFGGAAGVVGLIWFSASVKDPFSYHIDLAVKLKPPAFNLVVSDQLDEFLASSARIKTRVDAEIAAIKQAQE